MYTKEEFYVLLLLLWFIRGREVRGTRTNPGTRTSKIWKVKPLIWIVHILQFLARTKRTQRQQAWTCVLYTTSNHTIGKKTPKQNMSSSGHRLCVCAKHSYNQHKTLDKDLHPHPLPHWQRGFTDASSGAYLTSLTRATDADTALRQRHPCRFVFTFDDFCTWSPM